MTGAVAGTSTSGAGSSSRRRSSTGRRRQRPDDEPDRRPAEGRPWAGSVAPAPANRRSMKYRRRAGEDPGGGGRDVRDPHVAPGRGLGDDVGHQRPVDREEAPGRDPDEAAPTTRSRTEGAKAHDHHPGRADGAGDVDDRLAPDGGPRGVRPGWWRSTVHEAAMPGDRRGSRRLASSGPRSQRPLQVRHGEVDEERAAAQDEQAGADQVDEAPLAQDVRAPRLRGDRPPRPPGAILRDTSLSDAIERPRASSGARGCRGGSSGRGSRRRHESQRCRSRCRT